MKVTIKSTDWQEAKETNKLWLTIFQDYNPEKDLLWVNWEDRSFSIEKDYADRN